MLGYILLGLIAAVLLVTVAGLLYELWRKR